MGSDAELAILVRVRDQASRALGGIRGALGRVGGALQNLRMPIMIAVGAMAGLGAAAIAAGSDLEEATSKANVTFQASAAQVQEFAKTSAAAYGISKRAAFEYTSVLGNIMQASGLARDASAEMSIGMTQLAADMASFNNIPIDVALEKLRAGLVGEAEPLRTVGVLISDAAVKTQAYKDGLAEAGAELDEGQKVLARYNLIMEQTGNAQGDFARTSEGAANAQRILAARVDDLRSAIGQQLLPVWLAVMTFASETVLPFMEKWLPRAIDGVKQTFNDLRPAIDVLIASFKTGFETIRPVLERVFNFIMDNKPVLVAAIAAIGVAIVVAFGPVSIAIAAIVGLITAIGYIRDNWQMLLRETKRILGQIGDFMQTVFNNAANAVIGTVESMVNMIIDHLNRLAAPLNQMIGLWNKITGMDVGTLQLGPAEFGRFGGGPGALDWMRQFIGGGGLDEGVIDWAAITEAFREGGRQVGEGMGEGIGEGAAEALAPGGAGAAAVEEAAKTLLDLLAQHEAEIEQAWAIIAQTIERGTVRWQDVLTLTKLGIFGREVAEDFVRALQGESSKIGDAIFASAAESAREAAQEAAEAFYQAYSDAVGRVGDLMAGIRQEVSRLAGAETVESMQERLAALQLQQQLPGLTAAASAVREDRLARLVGLEESLAQARERLTAADEVIAEKQESIATLREQMETAKLDLDYRLYGQLVREEALDRVALIRAELQQQVDQRRIEGMQRQIDAAEGLLSEEERQLQAVQDEIAALQALGEARRIEREMAELQWRLQNESLMTDREVLEQIEAQTAAMQELEGIMGILNDGVLDVRDSFALLAIGLGDLAEEVMEIVSGLHPGFTQTGQTLAAGQPAPIIHIHRQEIHGNSREIMREMGRLVR